MESLQNHPKTTDFRAVQQKVNETLQGQGKQKKRSLLMKTSVVQPNTAEKQ